MTDVSPNRFLQKEGTGVNDELALKVFSGTVLEAFVSATKIWDNTGNILSLKTLEHGKSAQWPIIGNDPSASYHSPGDFMSGGTIKSSEAVITVNDYLVSFIDVAYADVNLSHFDVMRPYARKLGRSLATDMDKKLAIVGVDAARQDPLSGIHSGGNAVNRIVGSATTDDDVFADSATGSGLFRDDVAQLARLMDQDAVPEAGRYLFINPYIRSILRHETDLFNRDYNPDSLAGDLNNRVIGTMEGFSLIVSNNLPTTNTSADTSVPVAYRLDCDGGTSGGSRPVALALCGAQEGSSAIGLVQAAGLTSHIEKDERRNTFFLKSQMMVGAGIVSPWCAGEISWSAL
jgi:hypothetical protein